VRRVALRFLRCTRKTRPDSVFVDGVFAPIARFALALLFKQSGHRSLFIAVFNDTPAKDNDQRQEDALGDDFVQWYLRRFHVGLCAH